MPFKPDNLIKKRSNFAKLAFKEPEKAADKLRLWAVGLENCRTTNDLKYALGEILFLSEKTIERDLKL